MKRKDFFKALEWVDWIATSVSETASAAQRIADSLPKSDEDKKEEK